MARRRSSTARGDGRAVVLGLGGAIRDEPAEILVRTAFAEELDAQAALVDALSLTDLAHTVMLIERGVVPAADGARLLRALAALHLQPASFVLDPALGDVYTNREHWLLEREAATGWLGAGRARREATTTAYHLVVRGRLLDLAAALGRVGSALVDRAAEQRDTLMPDYTYLQVAQPTTFGHYLLGFAEPILRDLDRIKALFGRINQSPAGIGSGNGSLLAQDRDRLADLLGFDGLVQHGRDAVWQADVPIETIGVVVAALVNLDRLAEDLIVFATEAFGFIELSDAHARASKVLPQKRNPFALSYIRSAANRMIGVQAGIAAAARMPSGQPDTRTAATGEVPAGLSAAAGAADLAAAVVAGLRIDAARCRAALDGSAAAATDLASVLVRDSGIDFRTAHGIVARLVGDLRADGRRLADATELDVAMAARDALGERPAPSGDVVRGALDPTRAVAARGGPGGAAPEAIDAMVADVQAALAGSEAWRTATQARLAGRQAALMGRASELAELG